MPALLNVSSAAADTSANISWIFGGEHALFHIAYANKRKLLWPLLSFPACCGVEEVVQSALQLCCRLFTHFCTTVTRPLCTGEGRWQISEALNTSKTFYIIEGLEPDSEYSVRFILYSWFDNASIFEDVFMTKGEQETNFSRKGSRKVVVLSLLPQSVLHSVSRI